MIDWVKELWKVGEDWLSTIKKKEEKSDNSKVGVEEKTKEEILAEKIVKKYGECLNRKLLAKAFKAYGEYYLASNTIQTYYNSTSVCTRDWKNYVLSVDYEYAETFYKYLCKAVDKINAHVKNKELRRKTKELECMKKFTWCYQDYNVQIIDENFS